VVVVSFRLLNVTYQAPRRPPETLLVFRERPRLLAHERILFSSPSAACIGLQDIHTKLKCTLLVVAAIMGYPEWYECLLEAVILSGARQAPRTSRLSATPLTTS